MNMNTHILLLKLKTMSFITVVIYVTHLSQQNRGDAATSTGRTTEVATQRTSKDPQLSICPVNELITDFPVWRDVPHGQDVALRTENAVCSVGIDCRMAANTRSTDEVSDIIIEVQRGDWLNFRPLQLDTEPERNDSIEIRISNATIDGTAICTEITSPLVIEEWNPNTSNATPVKFDLLIPGMNFLSISLKSSKLQCEFMWRVQVTVKSPECHFAPMETICSGKGTCVADSKKNIFTCQCCQGYIGRYCEERDGCYGNPCNHGGFCVDITEGLVDTTFQCLCPHGYHGQSCDDVINLCDRQPCLNSATCWGNQTTYHCDCQPGFEGTNCEINIDECLSNPCVYGVCEDGNNGYNCYCLPGAGCTQHFDPCYPSPCENSGTCWPSLDSFFCSCLSGYTGDMCEAHLLYPAKPLAHTQGRTEKPQEGAVIDTVNVSLDHVHNIYIAASTLAGACLMAIIVVTICHCRVYKSYQRFVRKFGRSRAEKIKQQKTPFSNSVYEATTIDLSDNLDRPLIA
ncbi:protein eyes shut homolog isoform X3 [Tachypleus tridentatus]|uniref:protein eyes shut homolog isoform X3 n=1 Tax=Tachypleus tridentatus TaxID=6853 RepID=UPI003FD16FC2